jgi:hypothetical protein
MTARKTDAKYQVLGELVIGKFSDSSLVLAVFAANIRILSIVLFVVK